MDKGKNTTGESSLIVWLSVLYGQRVDFSEDFGYDININLFHGSVSLNYGYMLFKSFWRSCFRCFLPGKDITLNIDQVF